MADNNVEMQGIEIKITGDSSGYEKSVDKAVKKTSQFKSVLKEAQRIYAEQRPQLKFDTGAIDSTKKKISGLAQKMKDSIKGATSSINSDFVKIETPKMRWNIDSGEQMPQEMWNRLTQTIERLQDATKNPVKIDVDAAGVEQAKAELEGLKEQADAVKGAFEGTGAKIDIGDVDKAKEKLSGLTAVVQKVKDAFANFKDYTNAVKEIAIGAKVDTGDVDKARAKFASLAAAIERMKDAANNSTIGGIVSRAIEIAAEDERRKTALVPSNGGAGDAAKDVGEGASKSSGKLKEFIATLGSKLVEALAKAVSGLAKLAKFLGSKLLSGLKKAGTAVKDLAKTLGSKLTAPISKAVSGFNKLGKSFARIAMYRAIRAVLSSISQALKDGVNNIYQYSKALDGKLSKSMDSIATNVQLLKNSLGSIAAPIINAVAPAIDALVSKIVTLSNAIAQLFAKLGGQSTFTKAAKSATTYADAASGAAAANKDFTAGFDELNILSNSSGGGGSTADYGSMFEEVPIDAEIGSFTDKLKAAFDSDNFTAIGGIVAQKLNDIIDSVDFKSWGNVLGEKISNAIDVALGFLNAMDFIGVGQKLAEGLNGVMESLDFADIGELLAEKLNVLIDTVYGFVSTFEWGELGTYLSKVVNGWFTNIHLSTAAEALVKGINGVVNTVWNFLEGLDLKVITDTVSRAVNKAFEGVDFKKAGQTLGKAFTTVLDSLSQTIGKINWKQLGTDIAEFVGGIDWGEVIESMLRGIGSALIGLDQTLIGFVKPYWESFADWWKETAYEDGEFTIIGLEKGIKSKANDLRGWIKEHACDPITETFEAHFEMFGADSEVMKSFGKKIISSIIPGADIGAAALELWMSDFGDHLLNSADETGSLLTAEVNDNGVTIGGVFKEAIGWISEDSDSFLDAINQSWADTWEDMKKTTSEKWNSITTTLSDAWDAIRKAASEKWSNIKETIVSLFKGTKNEVEGISDDIQSAASSASSVVSSLKSSKKKLLAGSGYTMEAYASGGFVDQGSLFVAGEAGPELVGRIGGKTAVANSDQIVQAVASGVAGANSSVVNALYTLINVVQNIDTSVVIGDDEIGRSYDRYSTGRGARVNTGAFANAY